MFFRHNYFDPKSFFMSCHFTKIFVHLLIISAVSNFNVFKLIGWDPANTYLFKVNTIIRKKCEICSKLTIKTVQRGSGVFILNFEHISQLILMLLLFTMNRCLSESSFLCKYYYPKYYLKETGELDKWPQFFHLLFPL